MSEPPERIYNVSQTQFSIARHFGGVTFNNRQYIYIAADDMLIRDDVLRRDKKAERELAKQKREQAEQMQEQLFRGEA